LPFTWTFSADVRNGELRGQHGRAERPGWLLQGRIRPDGGAALSARGITGTVGYNI
jgi:hypothetical protein